MEFGNRNGRTPKPVIRERKIAPVFCVGWRAFVNWPQAAGEPPSPVPVSDSFGKSVDNDLADGQEVEIVAWRPRSRESALYHVRRSADGQEGWIDVQCLRRNREAPLRLIEGPGGVASPPPIRHG